VRQTRNNAETGRADAQLQLARLYLQGRGVPRDRTLALFWFNIAAAGGSREAVEERDKLEKSLTPTQIADAEMKGRNWKPKELLETPELEEGFREELLARTLDADHGFISLRTDKPSEQYLQSNGIEIWNTRVRFPGATAEPCTLDVVSDEAKAEAHDRTVYEKVREMLAQRGIKRPEYKPRQHPPTLFCSVFSSTDRNKVALFVKDLCHRLPEFLPQNWRLGSILESCEPQGSTGSIRITFKDAKADGASIYLMYDGSHNIGPSYVSLDIMSKSGCDDLCTDIPISELKKPLGEPTGQGTAQIVPGESGIRGEIDSIARSGKFVPLPEPQMVLGNRANSATAIRILRNDTSYPLHVLMSGPVDRRVDLAPGGSASIELPPGSYRVAARVDAAAVQPFYGVQVLEAGIEYTSQFFIK